MVRESSHNVFYQYLTITNICNFLVFFSQCHLDKEGASDLVVDLIINNHSSRIFLETVELGIALLEGGNSTIQVGRLTIVHVHFIGVCRTVFRNPKFVRTESQ